MGKALTRLHLRQLEHQQPLNGGNLIPLFTFAARPTRGMDGCLQLRIQMKQTDPSKTQPIIQKREPSIIALADVVAHDVKRAAIHEAGHFVVAEHYGLQCRIELTNEMREYLDKYEEYSVVKGQMIYPVTNKHFVLSACGWGGLLAEVAVDQNVRDAEALEDDARMQYFMGLRNMSHSDESSVFKHPQCWRACRNAARIIVDQRARIDEITRLALRHMIDEKQVRFNYPILPTEGN